MHERSALRAAPCHLSCPTLLGGCPCFGWGWTQERFACRKWGPDVGSQALGSLLGCCHHGVGAFIGLGRKAVAGPHPTCLLPFPTCTGSILVQKVSPPPERALPHVQPEDAGVSRAVCRHLTRGTPWGELWPEGTLQAPIPPQMDGGGTLSASPPSETRAWSSSSHPAPAELSGASLVRGVGPLGLPIQPWACILCRAGQRGAVRPRGAGEGL